ncbi:hypothetical protein D3C77_538080 [compost metagenome]
MLEAEHYIFQIKCIDGTISIGGLDRRHNFFSNLDTGFYGQLQLDGLHLRRLHGFYGNGAALAAGSSRDGCHT